MPPYLENRIRRPTPPGCFVVPGSTPVVSFGRFRTSTVATLGLNPSRQEFLDTSGNELIGPQRRFETLSSLEVPDLAQARIPLIERVANACEDYFDRNPYRRWFDQLEPVVQRVGASYYVGTACHLDLVQWATDPTWGALPPAIRTRLLGEDVPFLADQLRFSGIRLLLLNGRAVINFFSEATGVKMQAIAGITKSSFVLGELLGVRVIGWSLNLQSSFGVSNATRRELAERVAQVANGHGASRPGVIRL